MHSYSIVAGDPPLRKSGRSMNLATPRRSTVEVNTLRTGDADMRSYVTTVQDG